jgi:hypothetical protein
MKIRSGAAILLALCACLTPAFGQRNSVAAGGNTFGPGGQVNFSIGQLDYVPIYSIGGNLSPGNQQAYVVDVSGIFENTLSNEIRVYPNPAIDQVFVSVGNLSPTEMRYVFMSLDGKTIKEATMASSTEALPVSDIANGCYVVIVYRGAEKIKSFNLIKN